MHAYTPPEQPHRTAVLRGLVGSVLGLGITIYFFHRGSFYLACGFESLPGHILTEFCIMYITAANAPQAGVYLVLPLYIPSQWRVFNNGLLMAIARSGAFSSLRIIPTLAGLT